MGSPRLQWSRPHNGSHFSLTPVHDGNLTLLGTDTWLVIEFHSLKDMITWYRF